MVIIIKIGIVTRTLVINDVSVNGVPNTYLDIIKKDHYPILIDSGLDLKENQINLLNQIKEVDGFILPGGDSISQTDLYIIDYCYKNNIPLLGICLGMQEIGVYFNKNALNKIDDLSHFNMHEQYLHDITFNKQSYLYNLLNKDKINVNSRHKYHLKANQNYDIEAMSNNIIEAIKVKNTKYMLGLQFHPEIMYQYDDNAKLIFDDFFKQCKQNYLS